MNGVLNGLGSFFEATSTKRQCPGAPKVCNPNPVRVFLGTHVIVYTDEAYANTKHARTMGYTVQHDGGIANNGVTVYMDGDDDEDEAPRGLGQLQRSSPHSPPRHN